MHICVFIFFPYGHFKSTKLIQNPRGYLYLRMQSVKLIEPFRALHQLRDTLWLNTVMFVTKVPEASKLTKRKILFKMTCKRDHMCRYMPILTEMCVLARLPRSARSDETDQMCVLFHNTIGYASI